MKITVKFYVFDLPPGFEDAEIELESDAAISDVLDSCLELFKRRGAVMDENELRTATVLINGKWSDLNSPVSNKDIITIVRPMDGG